MWVCGPRWPDTRGALEICYCLVFIVCLVFLGKLPLFAFFNALFVMHGHVGNFFLFCNIVYNFAILSNVVSMFQVLPSLSILT
jgi:hypothetical protein